MSQPFKSCPFCGKADDLRVVVMCRKCHARADSDVWNTRPIRGKRQYVYDVIDGERAYQIEKWHEGGKNPVAAFLTFMQYHLTRAVAEGSTKYLPVDALHQVRKVTALGVACMEQHGAPPR